MKDIMFMQKTFNIIIKAALAIVLTAVAGGCVTDKLDSPKNLRSVMLQVDIETGEMTKATPSDAESGINSVRIYAFRADGVQAGHFYRANASANPIVMDMVLPETGRHNVKFYVFVNEASIQFTDGFAFTETMTQAQLMAAKIHNVNASYGLHIYCERTEEINVDEVSQNPNTGTGHLGHFYLTQKVTFSLIRPMAKLSVYAAMVDGGVPGSIKVESLGYQHNGTREYNYLLPQTADVLASVPLRNSGREMLANAVTLKKTVDKTDLTAVDAPENYELLVADQYLGETESGSDDWTAKISDRQAVIQVKYSVGGEIKLGHVYLPAVVRNNHYKVLILINSEGQILINYTIADWEDADVTQLTFDYPTHSYIRVAADTDDVPSAAAEMSETKPFTGYFKMSYPENEKWTPVLVSGSQECDLTVTKFGESTPLTPPISVSEFWYKIEVKPKSGSSLQPGDEVELAITYAPNYLDGVFDYLMINGSQGHPYWPTAPEKHDPNKVIITVK